MNRHFAALGDVWKHLVLSETLRLNPPRQYWETHAGSASYLLTESAARRHGAIRFISLAHTEPDLESSAYLRTLRSMPGKYAGSALLAMKILGPHAQYLLCDTDPQSAHSLRDAAGAFDCSVVESDGMSTIIDALEARSFVPNEVLIHIDPFDPFEKASADSPSAIELAGLLAQKGFRVLYWYGYESKADRAWARKVIASAAPQASLWCGDVMLPSPFVFAARAGTWGCGVVLVNGGGEVSALSTLGKALERLNHADILPGNDPERLTFQEM